MKKVTFFLFLFSLKIYCSAQGWHEVGTGSNALNANNSIYTLCSDGGVVYAAGHFTNGTSDTSGHKYVAKWNGTFWEEIGTEGPKLNANYSILTLCTDAAHNIYAAGAFANSSGKAYVAKCDGYSWSELGTGSNALNATRHISGINSICSDKFGNIYAAGTFKNSADYWYVAKWDGVSWSELGAGSNALNANNEIRSICADVAGNIYAAGYFIDSSSRNYVAKWNGTKWSKLGAPFNPLHVFNSGPVESVITDNAGNIYAAGWFSNISGYYYVAKWDGTDWSELGAGSNSLNANGAILSLATNSYGNIFATGTFDNSSGKHYVSEWNGTKWTEMGTGSYSLNAYGNAWSLSSDASGNVYTAGNFKNSFGYSYVTMYDRDKAGTAKIEQSRFVRILPNPSCSLVNIAIHENMIGSEYVLYDPLGKAMIKGVFNSTENSLNISGLSNGAYILSINTMQPVFLKLVKK